VPTTVSPDPNRPGHPTLFLVDGYALIYRAFFALLSRPLTTSHGENTSAAWGVVNFLQRLKNDHHPDHIAWILDSGKSFRHEVFPDYKATRQKLNEELQADFDRGLDRIAQLLSAYQVPIVSVDGFEADDVIGTLARHGVDGGYQVVIVSGDKDFQQLVRPGVWLLNPGRGGPAQVEEHWVGVHNPRGRWLRSTRPRADRGRLPAWRTADWFRCRRTRHPARRATAGRSSGGRVLPDRGRCPRAR
jgi:DNA polymerase-1